MTAPKMDYREIIVRVLFQRVQHSSELLRPVAKLSHFSTALNTTNNVVLTPVWSTSLSETQNFIPKLSFGRRLKTPDQVTKGRRFNSLERGTGDK